MTVLSTSWFAVLVIFLIYAAFLAGAAVLGWYLAKRYLG